jgi:SlyX protein
MNAGDPVTMHHLPRNRRPIITNPESPPLEDRLNEIEIKISYNEDLLDELNRTVFRQQQQIDALITEMRALREQVRTAEPGEPRNLRDEIPPHY